MFDGTPSAKPTRRATIGPLSVLACLLGLSFAQSTRAQDIPLDSCRTLATINVTTGRRTLRLLVDTGATSSMMNAKSFPEGDTARVEMHSWNGAFAADGRKADITDMAIGGRHLKAMTFLAVDLSDLERQCGEEIDGIMGADLIRKLGMEIDLKKRVARFAADPEERPNQTSDLSEQFDLCEAALNRSDEHTFRDCLDPDVVLVVSGKSYRGRDAVLRYFDHEYFADGRSTTMSVDRSTYHATGEAVWVEYELSFRFHDQAILERGTALFQKSGRKWLVVSLNHSVPREQ
jgi:ketosteroid isomerase-like protein